MDLLTTANPDSPELDMAFTGTLLDAVASGDAAESVRIFRPGPTLAFGRSDRLRAGFANACRVAESHGRTPVVRWGGGHAAAYDPQCLVVEVLRRHKRSPISGLESRFLDMVDLIQRALAGLGVTLEHGELPWEYCPGRYSLHLPSGPKIAGVAQRVLIRASLTTAVVVVDGGNAQRRTLADVYAALDLPLDIATVGALTDRHPEIDGDIVQEAIIHTAAARFGILMPEPAIASTSRGTHLPITEMQVAENV
jgi:octanoyl-[GcvH]:protein N-octanoyltransferase